MTREEHIARAMLLGMSHYNKNGGYYFRPSRMDVKTLEPINLEEAARRLEQAEETGKPYYDE